MADQCPICQEAILCPAAHTVLSKCRHRFHAVCLNEWFATQSTEGKPQTCPMCRDQVAPAPDGVFISVYELVALIAIIEAIVQVR